jgi:glycosyltransferase involved in cell wall biosynthesis
LTYLSTVQQRPITESGRLSWQNAALAVSQYIRFLKVLWRTRPQVIHIHTSQYIAWLKDTIFVLVGKLYRSKVILHVHAANYELLYGRWSVLIRAYTRMVMRLSDAIIAVSTEWGELLARIAKRDRVYVFKNCMGFNTNAALLTRPSTNGKKALFIGNIGVRKGAFDLIEAFALLKSGGCELHAWIAGYEEREGYLDRARARLKELRLEDVCELLGVVNGDKKAQLLNEAYFFVLPSYHEGLPMAILEAMAAGLPVVTTPVGGIPDVVRDGFNGFLVSPGDIVALAEKMAVLTNDQHLCEIMGKRSREIVEQELDVKPYANRLVTLYQELATE